MNRESDTYTAADLFVDALDQYGVQHVFGNPGTTELPVVHSVLDSDLDYILALHEDIAVGMAGGYAMTRRYHSHANPDVMPVGVVNLHIAPGTAHGIGNLYAADWAGAPIIVTAGNYSRDFRHEDASLSGDMIEMTKQCTKWSDEVLDPSALPTMLRRAFRVALTPPTGPVFLSLPLDVMMEEVDAEPERLGSIPRAGGGDREQIERATQYLLEAEEPVIVVGDGVARSGREAIDAAVSLAEASGARVHGEIMSSEISFPTGHEQWAAFAPLSENIITDIFDTDTIVFVGCSSNTTLGRYDADHLVTRDATCIHIGDDAWQLGKNQPADAAIIGDPRDVLSELATRVEEGLSGAERSRRLDQTKARNEEIAGVMDDFFAPAETEPGVSKIELAKALENAIPDPYIVDEGITSKDVLMNEWALGPEQLVSNKGAGLGYGLPASVGAALAEGMVDDPRDVIGFVGDGSYLYYPQSLYTAARYDLDLTVVVPDNRSYYVLKLNTLGIFGGDEDDYEWEGALDFVPPVDIPMNAKSHGADSDVLPDPTPEDVERAVGDAIESSGPTVLDIGIHD